MAAIAEELASSIDDGCYITTRWLAFKHNIKMTEAEKICEEYSSQHGVHASYLVSGRRSACDKVNEVKLVSKDVLEDTKKDFDHLHGVHIYALYKSDTDSLSTQLSSMNQSQVAALMVNSHEALVRNAVGRIRHPSVTLQAIGARTFAPRDLNPAPVPTKKLTPSTSSITSAPAAKKAAKAAASFFDKAPSSKPSSANKQLAQNTSSPTTTAGASTPTPPVATNEDSDDEGEWDNANKTDKSKIKRRETYHATDEIIETVEDVEEVAPASPQKKQKRHVHGAMDDILEDMALSGALQASPVKKKRKKLVEKMFSDEKGYLVTQMVWEEVTDDEAPPAKQHDVVPPKKASTLPQPSKKKKDDNKSAAQKSMTSFFTKKK